jgi:hypothetical protein
MVIHACEPSYSGAQVGGSRSEVNQGKECENLSKKYLNKKGWGHGLRSGRALKIPSSNFSATTKGGVGLKKKTKM